MDQPRPTKKPNGGMLSKSEDEDFENFCYHTVSRTPTHRWKFIKDIWAEWPRVNPATRRRLLCFCLKLCSDRRNRLPEILAIRAQAELAPLNPSRNRVRDPEKLVRAARFSARNPSSSLSEIAVAVGLKPSNKTTIREYRRQPLFRRAYKDEARLIEIEKWRAAGNKDAPFPRQLTEEELSKRIVQTKTL